jgi:ribonuclease HII
LSLGIYVETESKILFFIWYLFILEEFVLLICGVDDAGRGAIVGPLVVAGVVVHKKDLIRIRDIGVKDSKLLSPKKRNHLFCQILKIIKNHTIVKLSPANIDEVVEKGKKFHRLNRLEAKAMAKTIQSLKPDVAYVDASDVLPERFGKNIAEELSFDIQIISEHKADITYPIVSAASIIAKVERDSIIAKIRRKYGDLGSGYMSDRKTVNFLEKWIREYKKYPKFVRKSWKPAKKIKAKIDLERF